MKLVLQLAEILLEGAGVAGNLAIELIFGQWIFDVEWDGWRSK